MLPTSLLLILEFKTCAVIIKLLYCEKENIFLKNSVFFSLIYVPSLFHFLVFNYGKPSNKNIKIKNNKKERCMWKGKKKRKLKIFSCTRSKEKKWTMNAIHTIQQKNTPHKNFKNKNAENSVFFMVHSTLTKFNQAFVVIIWFFSS